jgi:hypothetical protein
MTEDSLQEGQTAKSADECPKIRHIHWFRRQRVAAYTNPARDPRRQLRVSWTPRWLVDRHGGTGMLKKIFFSESFKKNYFL